MTKQELKDSISDVIKSNGSGGITGTNLQEKLFEIIDECFNNSELIQEFGSYEFKSGYDYDGSQAFEFKLIGDNNFIPVNSYYKLIGTPEEGFKIFFQSENGRVMTKDGFIGGIIISNSYFTK